MSAFLILGCGYTGARVARRLLAGGAVVHVTARDPGRVAALASAGATVHALDLADERSHGPLAQVVAALGPGLRVVHSVPVVRGAAARGIPPHPCDATESLLRALGAAAARVVYLSTTGVYGDVAVVDETTPPAPSDEASRLRVEAERTVLGGSWSALVLRPAAIYGPHRGVHVALRGGTLGRVRDLDRIVSRVHVDDLAAIVEVALLSDASGAFPVADDEPATTREVASFCERLGLPPLQPAPEGEGIALRGRSVDGRAIRRVLGVELRYPSYREGIPAAIEEERGGE